MGRISEPVAEAGPRVKAWLAELGQEKRLAAATLESYRRDIGQFLQFLGEHKGAMPGESLLADITPGDLRAFLARRRAEGISPASAARALSALRNFYRHTERHGGNSTGGHAAIAVIRAPRRKRRLPRAVNQSAMQTLLAGAEKSKGPAWLAARDLALLALLYGAGLRLGEALGLRGEALAAGETLRITGKGGKERLVPLLPVVRALAAAYRRLCPFPLEAEGPLFLSQKGRALSPRQVQLRLMQLRRRLGLGEGLTPHALRHSFASHLLAKSGNLRLIQELLGHASLSTTQIYADLEDEDVRRAYAEAHPRAGVS